MTRLGTRLAAAALVAFAALGAAAAESTWPPTGPLKWETDPEAAFARARKEHKGVFVYIATES
jgi:hypothetical protein